jgi:hypothetical protein
MAGGGGGILAPEHGMGWPVSGNVSVGASGEAQRVRMRSRLLELAEV